MRLHYSLAVAIAVALTGSISADDNVREVQTKLRDGGFYSGEIDGAYSAQLAEALKRYQSRNGLPLTGQLDVETSNVLGAKPAVTKNRVDVEPSSDSEGSPKHERQTSVSTSHRSSASADEIEPSTRVQPRSAPVATAQRSSTITGSAQAPPRAQPQEIRSVSAATGTGQQISSENTTVVSAPAAPVSQSGSSEEEISTERLRDYVGAFVRAGVDPNIGMEADFFADRVRYYDQGVVDREQIRNDLLNYAAHWPERHFWFAGNLTIEQQRRHRVRVTFPLQYELRNGATQTTGAVNKTVVLEPAGDDLKIVAVSEQRPE